MCVGGPRMAVHSHGHPCERCALGVHRQQQQMVPHASHAELVGDAFSASAIDATGVDVTAPRASRSASWGRDTAAVATSPGSAVVAMLASTTSAFVSRGANGAHSPAVQPTIHQLYPPPSEGASSSCHTSDQEDAISEPARPAPRAIERGRPRGRVKPQKGSLPTALREELGRECSLCIIAREKRVGGAGAGKGERRNGGVNKERGNGQSQNVWLWHTEKMRCLALRFVHCSCGLAVTVHPVV